MICPQCGAETVAEALFCHKCGASMRPPEQSGLAPDQPPPTAQEQFAAAVTARRTVEDERAREMWVGTYSCKAMAGTWLLCGLAMVVALVAAAIYLRGSLGWTVLLVAILLMWGYALVLWLSRSLGVQYRLTSQRFCHEKGILSHTTNRVDVFDIEDVICRQGPLQRLLGVGTIRIKSRDRTDPDLVIGGIENPGDVASMIDDVRRAERIRRGLMIQQGGGGDTASG